MQQVARASTNDPINHYGVNIQYIQSDQEAKEVINTLLQSNVLALDIETYPQEEGNGLDPFTSNIRLIQIYDGSKNIYVFDLKSVSLDSFPLAFWKKPVVCHNALFELKHLLHRGCDLENIGCTMIMAFIVKGQSIIAGLSLKKITQEYLNIDLSKEEQLSDWSKDNLTDSQIRYAGVDALVTYHLFLKLRKVIMNKRLSKAS